MIRISLATVKQTAPRILHRTRLDRDADDLDAILAIIPAAAPAEVFERLPETVRWRTVAGRDPAPGSVHVTALGNARQTRAILGILPANASVFDTLALAGRMVKDLGSVAAVGLAVPAVAPAAPATAGKNTATGGGSDERALEALLSAVLAQSFQLPSWRREEHPPRRLRRIELQDSRLDVERANTVADANNLARWLTALPPNKLTAETYRRLIGEAARSHGLTFRWLDEAALRRLGAGAFLAVAAGNERRNAGIAHLRYRPRKTARKGKGDAPAASRTGTAPDVALVGKGILFDTGGTNLKSHRGMLDMHTDMAGSAVALATLCALAELRAPIAVDCWLAISENSIGPCAYRPQDVVTAANGLTIQVIHTDAEGRMVLADTLALAARARPRLVIDYATLTGACVTALTERMSGVFATPPELAPHLVAAGARSGERVWPFPLDADFDSDLDSKVADIMQCTPDSKGDHILAARFLSRFLPAGMPWIHMDLAAATRSGGLGHINTEITGFGVRHTLELLRDGLQPLLAPAVPPARARAAATPRTKKPVRP